MRRYENRSTLMTSNRPIEGIRKLRSDVPAASAILDRLLHHAEGIAITGRSYRSRTVPINVHRPHTNPAHSIKQQNK
jgi:DNA replication protein DnaC